MTLREGGASRLKGGGASKGTCSTKPPLRPSTYAPRPRWSPEGLGPNPEKVGPEGWGPEGWGPEGWEDQNFALFFSFSRRKFHSFFSLGVFSLNFGGVLKTKTFKCARLEFSGCHVKPRWPGLVGPPGFHTTAREPKRTFLGPGLQKHHQNSTRRHPERHKKSETVAGKGRKRAKLWAPPPFGAPPSGPHPFGPPPFRPPSLQP